jgi:signal transduction histidine kinase
MADSSPPTAALPDSPAALGRLVARERVRAMESLASLIAHEIRSSVLGVTSAAQLLRYALPQDPVAEKSLGRILQESERLSTLHEALSEYATEVPPRSAPIDPDGLWDTVLANMRGALEANSVSLIHVASPAPAVCLVDEEQMTRALERIIHHAIARGQTGSQLRIESSVESGAAWRSEISVASAARVSPKPGGGDFERPTFLIALANRTLVAHGGEVVDHSGEDASMIVTVRLPLSSSIE